MRRPLSRVNLAKLRELPAEVRQKMTRRYQDAERTFAEPLPSRESGGG
jgi:hypothetical protein